jgi:hypothetical protein
MKHLKFLQIAGFTIALFSLSTISTWAQTTVTLPAACNNCGGGGSAATCIPLPAISSPLTGYTGGTLLTAFGTTTSGGNTATYSGPASPSTSGGAMLYISGGTETLPVTGAETILTGLTVGQKYIFQVEWAPVSLQGSNTGPFGTTTYSVGAGKLRIQVKESNELSFYDYSTPNSNVWQTEIFSFTATGTTATIVFGATAYPSNTTGVGVAIDAGGFNCN